MKRGLYVVFLTDALPFNVTLGFVIVGLWELGWKGFGLWRSGRANQLYWFIAMLVLNTVGVLPIIYLLFFQKKRKSAKSSKRKESKKRSVKKRRK